MTAEQPVMTLVDTVLGQTLIFFKDFDEMTAGRLALDTVDERLDILALGIQSTNLARSNPDQWMELVPGPISSYEYLWPCEQVMLFLLANYAAIHASLQRDVECPLISPQSLAWEILSLEWLPGEAGSSELVERFLAHPAAQVPKDGLRGLDAD